VSLKKKNQANSRKKIFYLIHWYMPVIPAHGRRGRGIVNSSWQHTSFEASLGYIGKTLFQKTKINKLINCLHACVRSHGLRNS
jgi:hypothetical protein